jgi:hypothetical protein
MSDGVWIGVVLATLIHSGPDRGNPV